MAKQRSSKDEPKAAPADEATPPACVPAGETDAAVTPMMALVGIGEPKLDPPAIETPAIEAQASEAAAAEPLASPPAAIEPAVVQALPVLRMSPFEAFRIEAASREPPRIDLASIVAPRIAPEIDETAAPAGDDAAAAPDVEHGSAAASSDGAAPRFNRFTVLAASLVLAAAFGGMAGALGAYGLLQPAPAPVVVAGRVSAEDVQALKENIVQARVELAALKVSIEAANRTAGTQFTRIGERIERIERVQAEPTTKLNKAIETLDRLSRAEAAAQKDVTGSITPPQTVGGAPANAGVVDGWVVREVHRNTALLEGRMGLIEVDKGDMVPGLGRIEAIRKQDGRWVVVTSKGLIMSAR